MVRLRIKDIGGVGHAEASSCSQFPCPQCESRNGERKGGVEVKKPVRCDGVTRHVTLHTVGAGVNNSANTPFGKGRYGFPINHWANVTLSTQKALLVRQAQEGGRSG